MTDISLLNTIDIHKAKDELITLVTEANNQAELLYITVDDKPQAVLIGYEIFSRLMARLDELEDLYDTADAIEAVERYEQNSDNGRPWESVKAELYK